jgi:hypothetical protein
LLLEILKKLLVAWEQLHAGPLSSHTSCYGFVTNE